MGNQRNAWWVLLKGANVPGLSLRSSKVEILTPRNSEFRHGLVELAQEQGGLISKSLYPYKEGHLGT